MPVYRLRDRTRRFYSGTDVLRFKHYSRTEIINTVTSMHRGERTYTAACRKTQRKWYCDFYHLYDECLRFIAESREIKMETANLYLKKALRDYGDVWSDLLFAILIDGFLDFFPSSLFSGPYSGHKAQELPLEPSSTPKRKDLEDSS